MTSIAILMPQKVFDAQMNGRQLEQLRDLTADGSYFHATTMESLLSHPMAEKFDVLMTGWSTPKLTCDLLDACKSLKLVVHCAGTVRHLVDPSFFDRNIRLVNSADANAVPVAEFLLSWILRWNKKLPLFENKYRAGHFIEKKVSAEFDLLGNRGKTIGVVSASRVGRRLIGLLKHFELDVLLCDPFCTNEQTLAIGARKVELPELMSASDIVSICAPLLPETENLIGATQLAHMKDGALLINTSRGKLVDHDALLSELVSGRLNAVLDVTEPEPLPPGSPFFSLPNAYLTPHVAGSMGLEIHRMTDSALSEIELFLSSGNLRHSITLNDWAIAA